MQKISILFLVFNRPDTTIKVFEKIKKYKPEQLFVAADGPRKEKHGELEKCKEVRDVVSKVDWPCKVHRLYRDKNLGCKKAVSSAIDWFFDNVNEGIILEDDCLPNPSFFRFCEEMLEKYRNNKRIFHITGDNFQLVKNQSNNSYYFSKYAHVWGWATWKRAWKHYDVNMKSWREVKKKGVLNKYWSSFWEKKYWETIYDATYSDKIDTWDYQWLYAMSINDALSIIPGVNLVQNIGFGAGGTHITRKNKLLEVKTKKMNFPLKSPLAIIENLEFDNYSSKIIVKSDPLTVIILKIKFFIDNYFPYKNLL